MRRTRHRRRADSGAIPVHARAAAGLLGRHGYCCTSSRTSRPGWVRSASA